MKLFPPHPTRGRTRAFTLIEVLIATLIFSVIVAAMNAAFYGSLRLRTNTAKLVEDMAPMNRAASILKADLRGILSSNITGGPLAGAFTGLNQGAGGSQLQMFTTTGVLETRAVQGEYEPLPWGDVQHVSYYLTNSFKMSRTVGKDLIRAVTRNVMATSQPDLLEQAILTGVNLLEILYYDGTTWRDTWDSTMQTPAVPLAVKVHVEFAPRELKEAAKPPLEVVVPLLVQAPTNTTSMTGGTQ